MSRYVSDALRSIVAARTNYCCEYCRLPLRYSFFSFQIDHIVSLKHGGRTAAENLALACGFCNSNKGADIGTFIDSPKSLIRFFNPREDDWHEHFQFEGTEIIPKTGIGEATVKILCLNDFERLMERQILMNAGLYPL